MNIRRWALFLGFTAFAASSVGAFSYNSAMGEFRTSYSGLAYSPGRSCSTPLLIGRSDNALRMYRLERDAYLDCLKNHAEADMQYAQRIVQVGYDSAVEDFLSEERLMLSLRR